MMLRARQQLPLVLTVLGCGLLCAGATDHTGNLAIVEAGISSSEDAPFVPADYAFMPGDYLYFVFQVAGFKRTDKESGADGQTPQKISIHYRLAAVDANDVPLAPPESGSVEQEVGSEDKDWQPKRRASFLLPSYIAAGACKVRVTVDDAIAKTSVVRDFPFRVGGVTVHPGAQPSVQNFRFLRAEDDNAALEDPVYRAGDTVWGRFEMAGFKLGPENTAELRYGVTVRRGDGSVLFEDKAAAAEKITGQYYPPAFLPGSLSVNTTKDLSHGEYTLNVHLFDLIGKQESDYTTRFRIE